MNHDEWTGSLEHRQQWTLLIWRRWSISAAEFTVFGFRMSFFSHCIVLCFCKSYVHYLWQKHNSIDLKEKLLDVLLTIYQQPGSQHRVRFSQHTLDLYLRRTFIQITCMYTERWLTRNTLVNMSIGKLTPKPPCFIFKEGIALHDTHTVVSVIQQN